MARGTLTPSEIGTKVTNHVSWLGGTGTRGDFSNTDLTSVTTEFRGKNLTKAIFSQSLIKDTDLSAANIDSCLFLDTSCDAVVFTDCSADNIGFLSTEFKNCDLSNTSFNGCVFFQTVFNIVSFKGATFTDCDFISCEFTDADVTEATRTNTTFT